MHPKEANEFLKNKENITKEGLKVIDE